ncbi:hypothetical protein KKD19_01400 [Patescibacteria group bacterium]|nr:hypothetical protein [Patescibacteria group bacterium]MBU4511888.1 hypothetical protein [Patescibacteria group bacterium]MCG2692856.1 hypothetical protein [Candidatus Parcubacteria bacterium]
MNRSKAPYYGGKKTWVQGVLYDSKLEARMATLLHKYEIPFTPHVKFEVYDRQGKPFSYTVDFFLHQPVKFAGIPTIIQCLEVKGILTMHDINRCDALEYRHHYTTWIVNDFWIKMWEREGMFWKEEDRYRLERKKA